MRLPKIDRILAADGELQPLLAKTRELSVLAGLVNGFLSPELARQTRIANLREGDLVLLAANPAVAAKLRLLAPSLSRFLAMQRWQVSSVSIRVQMNMSQSRRGDIDVAVQKSAQFSAQNLAALRALYETMSDSPARAVLHALLERRNAAAKPPPANAPQRATAKQGGSRKRRT